MKGNSHYIKVANQCLEFHLESYLKFHLDPMSLAIFSLLVCFVD